MDGILPLYKERGMTSNDAVFKCRKIFKTRRVGHSGTLDPNVDGVLPICIGKATKVVNYMMDSGKIYMGEITLGFATETEDLDGAVIAEKKLTEAFTDEEITAAMQKLTGTMIQIPPMYSAIKVNGRRLYDYARKGEEVQRPERTITVDYFKQIKKAQFDASKGQQTIYFEVGCGRGTYVRTLAVDLGKTLGVPAVMSDLTRLKSGGFLIGETVSLAQLQELTEPEQLAQKLMPIEHALKKFPKYVLSDEQWKLVKNGGFLNPRYINKGKIVAQLCLFYEDRVRCIYKYNENKMHYQPEQMIDLT
ncbi:tRNA pseudouridine(55) synthase TruB [Ligilactobacillus sp. WILCCON 0076]|uniref:tRNA pseudouridine synthase B n=1 Tax=Ligilactobacillus ubinensis TaxID=2876789 RepID=A0A9X2FKI9_9LACO|nr:tRNA pseudouridine(55) synthase TruB [Ligilactobacillus ubinensis]MCP0886023.1 tRNA pseudouridine(55) synthase TruB [Ligilactobacillus ubinensis]